MKTPWWLCRGLHWRSLGCLLDVLTGCRFRWVCLLHDWCAYGDDAGYRSWKQIRDSGLLDELSKRSPTNT